MNRKDVVSSIEVALVLAGLGLVAYGAHAIYQPAGYITLGAGLIVLGFPGRGK